MLSYEEKKVFKVIDVIGKIPERAVKLVKEGRPPRIAWRIGSFRFSLPYKEKKDRLCHYRFVIESLRDKNGEVVKLKKKIFTTPLNPSGSYDSGFILNDEFAKVVSQILSGFFICSRRDFCELINELKIDEELKIGNRESISFRKCMLNIPFEDYFLSLMGNIDKNGNLVKMRVRRYNNRGFYKIGKLSYTEDILKEIKLPGSIKMKEEKKRRNNAR